MEINTNRYLKNKIYVMICMCIIGAIVHPVYAAGLDELFSSILDFLTPIIEGLQKLSWVVALVAGIMALFKMFNSNAARTGGAESWDRLKLIAIAVVAINLLAGLLGIVQSTVESNSLSQDISSLYQ